MITTVPGCVDTCAIPQPCRTHGVRVPASCVAHAPEAQGSSLRCRCTGPGVPIRTAHLRTWAAQVSGVPEDAPTPRWAVFLAGALAGCTATCLCYPLDVVPRCGQRWPGSQQPTRPPAAPEAHPLARGCSHGPERSGAPLAAPHAAWVPTRGLFCGGAPVRAHVRRFRCLLATQVSGRGRRRAGQVAGGAAGVGLRAGSTPSLYCTLRGV